MLRNYLILLLLVNLRLIIAENHRGITYNHDNVISISAVLGQRLIIYGEVSNKLIINEEYKTIVWYKGSTSLSIDSNISRPSRYSIINQTKLLIEQTLIGDEGFYTLKIQTKSNIYKQYLCHVGSL